MFKFFIKISLLFFILTTFSQSKNFNNIIVSGNERISDETILVFADIPNKVDLDEDAINVILKSLYKSGFFKDVVIEIKNQNLLITVVENPIIQNVFIEGVPRKKTTEAINDVISLKDRSSFNVTSVKEDELSISNYLKKQGYFFSSVVSSIEDLGNNKINLYYKIDLGNKARITKISFVGNKKFKDNVLRNVIVSEEYKFWKIISGKKFLNEDLVLLDKRLLRNFYKNKGFYKVNIESSFANFLGDDKFELIYNISSGKKYFFDNLDLKLPLDYDVNNFNELQAMLSSLKGESYSLKPIEKILNEIDKIVLSKQYEFLKATVSEKINDNLINLVFNIAESEKFYVEKINILGNNVTQEQVIRNTFVVDEGDAFNELLYKKTINNLKALNFFSDISSEIIDGSLENQKVINITVDEKPTGEISAGAGVGTNGGTVGFGVSENNFLGRGIEFSSNLSLTAETIKGLISFNNQNFKGSNKSLNFSLESSVTDRMATYGYESKKTGFSIASGYEYYEDLYLIRGFSSYVENLETSASASASLKKQKGSSFDNYFNYTFNYDKRDQKYKPTDGFISSFSQNIPVLTESYALTNTYSYKNYNEWLSNNIFSFSFYTKATNSLSGKNVKISDRLFLPANKLRGFESGKIGPKDGTDYIGGNYAVAINLVTSLPQILPNLQNTDFSIFLDVANIWGIDYNSVISEQSKIRSSIGLGVDIFTAIGPLNFSFAKPITKSKNDVTESFRFNLGTTF